MMKTNIIQLKKKHYTKLIEKNGYKSVSFINLVKIFV